MFQSLKRTYTGFVLIKISEDVEIRCKEMSEVHKIWWCRIYKTHLYEFHENMKTSLSAEISLCRNINSTWALITLLPLKCKYVCFAPMQTTATEKKNITRCRLVLLSEFQTTMYFDNVRSLKRTYILALWIFRKCMKFGNAKFIKTMQVRFAPIKNSSFDAATTLYE